MRRTRRAAAIHVQEWERWRKGDASMCRVVQAVALVLGLAVFSPTESLAGGNANVIIGKRAASGQWSPVDGQRMLGAAVDWGMDDWPVHLAWGLNVSADETDDYWNGQYSAALTELSFGLLWLPIRDRSFRPYVGAGIASVFADLEIDRDDGDEQFDIDDYDFGYYVNAGMYWRLGSRFNLGLDLRYGWGARFDLILTYPSGVYREKDFVEGDYLAYSLLLGFGWGK